MIYHDTPALFALPKLLTCMVYFWLRLFIPIAFSQQEFRNTSVLKTYAYLQILYLWLCIPIANFYIEVHVETYMLKEYLHQGK